MILVRGLVFIMSILKIQKDQELQRLQPYFSKKLQAETDLQIILKKSNRNGQIEMNLKKFITSDPVSMEIIFFVRLSVIRNPFCICSDAFGHDSCSIWFSRPWSSRCRIAEFSYEFDASSELAIGTKSNFNPLLKLVPGLEYNFFTLRENHFEIGWMINYIFEWNYTTMQGVTHF